MISVMKDFMGMLQYKVVKVCKEGAQFFVEAVFLL